MTNVRIGFPLASPEWCFVLPSVARGPRPFRRWFEPDSTYFYFDPRSTSGAYDILRMDVLKTSQTLSFIYSSAPQLPSSGGSEPPSWYDASDSAAVALAVGQRGLVDPLDERSPILLLSCRGDWGPGTNQLRQVRLASVLGNERHDLRDLMFKWAAAAANPGTVLGLVLVEKDAQRLADELRIGPPIPVAQGLAQILASPPDRPVLFSASAFDLPLIARQLGIDDQFYRMTASGTLTPNELDTLSSNIPKAFACHAPSLAREAEQQLKAMRGRGASGHSVADKATEALDALCIKVFNESAISLLRPLPEWLTAPACPFRGLLPFAADDHHLFFGRADVVNLLVEKCDLPLTVVAGTSGVGKTSLLNAGLRRACTDVGRSCHYRDAKLLQIEQIQQELEAVRTDDPGAIYVIDHFEALCAASSAGAVVSLCRLLVSTQRSVLSVVVSTRTCALQPLLDVGVHLNDVVILDGFSPREIESIVTQQASQVHVDIDHAVFNALRAEIGVHFESATLVMQHAIRRLWDYRIGQRLTADSYHDRGGVGGIIAEYCGSVIGAMSSADQAIAKNILVRLHARRKYAAVTEFPSRAARANNLLPAPSEANHGQVAQVLELLVGSRLVVSYVGKNPQEILYHIVHESLCMWWPKLKVWLDQDDGSSARRDIMEFAQRWDELGRPSAYLQHAEDSRLRTLRRLHTLPNVERDYVEACIADGQRRRARRTVVRAGAISILIAIGATGAYLTLLRNDVSEGRAAATAEIGRQHLLSGYPQRALAYLNEAVRLGDESYPTRFMIREAESQARVVLLPAAPLALSDDTALVPSNGRSCYYNLSTGQQNGCLDYSGTAVLAQISDGTSHRAVLLRADEDLATNEDTVRIGGGATSFVLDVRIDSDASQHRIFPVEVRESPIDLNVDWSRRQAVVATEAALYYTDGLGTPGARIFTRITLPKGGAVIAAHFSTDGTRVAVARSDGSVLRYDIEAKKLAAGTAAERGKFYVWPDMSNRNAIDELASSSSCHFHARKDGLFQCRSFETNYPVGGISENGTWVVTQADESLLLRHTENGSLLPLVYERLESYHDVSVSDDGSTVAIAFEEGIEILRQGSHFRVIESILQSHAIRLSHDGCYLVVGSLAISICVGIPVTTDELHASSTLDTLTEWAREQSRRYPDLGEPIADYGGCQYLAKKRDGENVVFAVNQCAVAWFSESASLISLGHRPEFATFSADGTRAVVMATCDPALMMAEEYCGTILKTGENYEILATIPYVGAIRGGPLLSADGRLVVFVTSDGWMAYDSEHGLLIPQLDGSRSGLNPRFADNAELLVREGSNAVVEIWSTSSGRLLARRPDVVAVNRVGHNSEPLDPCDAPFVLDGAFLRHRGSLDCSR